MVWKVEFSTGARRQLRKLDNQHARRVLKFLHDRVSVAENPRFSGKALKGEFGNYWRNRLGDYRILCHIEDKALVILVIRVRHRKDIYR